MQKDLMAVKKEEKEESGPVRPRTTKGKGKEPVRQTARKEASNAPADQVMEDEPLENYEPLFGTFGLSPLQKRFLILTYGAVQN